MAEQWRILVVEGEENLNWNIVNTLQKDSYFVRGVTSGAEAIRLLWSEECDVVVCNQQMPDADGFDLLQWMRTYCPNTRMVMVAAVDSGVTRTQALEMGVASYLEKPLDMRALKEELRRLLHQTGFSASLDSFDLLDVIQIINMSRKSIALVVSIGVEEEGILRFQNGELIWAEYGMLRGEEAFFALAAHKNGTVVHRPWSEQITPNVTQPLSRLIFQALQYRAKYAEYQQLSSEQEIIRPANIPSSPTLPSLSPTTLPASLQDLEADDRPFQFVAEDLSVENAPLNTGFEQFMFGNAPQLEQVGGFMGTIKHSDQGSLPGSEDNKEWWEPTGGFPSLKSGNLRAITDEALAQAQQANPVNITPSTVHRAAPTQNNGLPTWLTDQPTYLDLPVLRGNTGQMPAAPKEQTPNVPLRTNTGHMPIPPKERPPVIQQQSTIAPLPAITPMSPVVPVTPGQPQTSGAEWPDPRLAGLSPSESGLRKIKLDEALYTGTQRAIRTGNNQPAMPMQPASAEWTSSSLTNQTGQMSPVKPTRMPEHGGEVLQSLAALKKNHTPTFFASEPRLAEKVATPIPPPPRPAQEIGLTQEPGPRNRTQPVPMGDKTGTSKPNYPALAAALQTLGYSVPGFVASAVVGIDGTPIAQVAVDELDISPMCIHLSNVIQSVLLTLDQGRRSGYEYTVITSHAQHILLRIVGKKKDVFQVLITTREANPAESLEVMANVEAAIATALH